MAYNIKLVVVESGCCWSNQRRGRNVTRDGRSWTVRYKVQYGIISITKMCEVLNQEQNRGIKTQEISMGT
jgi:hypothetical protein